MAHSSPPMLEADGPALPAASELVYESERTRVFRAPASGGSESVLYKERLDPDALSRARNEARILERLSGVDGVPRLAAAASGRVIALKDVAGVVLAEAVAARRLEPHALVGLARRLALIVADMHRRGVVHKDINPTNILIAGDDGRPVLNDFDLATTFAEDRPGFVHHREIAGTLPYLAPEQSGRTGRPVDHRADLYALGATLYELAVGHPPFEGSDPLQLIHDHLARVPVPPAAADPRVPIALSDIVMRLLEKEPDRRYQSADGLAHDLARLSEMLAKGENEAFPLGQRDFPLRLSPPSRLFGRQADVDRLRQAFDHALAGQGRAILVAGAPGVGKTALIDELRPVVAARGGWFLAGKFDQYGHDASGAVVQVLRALGRMLLAEPEARLEAERRRIAEALGENAGLIAAVAPEFATLSGATAEAARGDPVKAEAQLRLAVLALLRAVASPDRPVVMVLDDLQWAHPGSIRIIDALLVDEELTGLLLVGAYRDAEIDAAHPLTAMLASWRRQGVVPPLLRLANLPPADLGGMLADMLRLPAAEALRLAEALGARTGGNPFDTVELVNALRRDAVLVLGPQGWSWDDAAIRRHVGGGEVVDLLAARIARLPRPARALLQVMACVGGDVEIGLLQAAAGLAAAALEEALASALEDGLLVLNHRSDAPGLSRHGGVRFRHDRVQQAAHDGMRPLRRRAVRITVARRLANLAEYRSRAAEPYLAAVEAVDTDDERVRVAAVFQDAAARARLTANDALAERYLAAAMRLLRAGGTDADASMFAAAERDRHQALYNLGRLEEADEIYRSIEHRGTALLDLVQPACVQVNSLCNRGSLRQAVELGLDLMRRLGADVPDDVDAAIAARLGGLARSTKAEGAADATRPEPSDPVVLGIARLLAQVATPAHFANPPMMAWLVLESHRILVEHGPCAPVIGNLGLAPVVTIARAEDYRTGYEVARDALAVGEARRYEPETSRARVGFANFGSHWFEPLEHSIAQAHRARESLLRAGDLQFACLTFYTTLAALFDCAATLDECAVEIEAALTLAMRTGNERAAASFVAYRQVLRSLRGETSAPGSLTDASFDETAHMAGLASNPTTAAGLPVHLALAATLFGDQAKAAVHAGEAVRRASHLAGLYRTALAQLLHALSLADQCRGAAPERHAALIPELDAARDWLAHRAADCPVNFAHLLRLVDAERAAATGQFWDATRAFDAAVREAELRQRPWHQALIAERAGMFHLSQGLEQIGRELLLSSRRHYEAWGATGKVKELERTHAFLRGTALRPVRAPQSMSPRRGSSTFSSDAIDLLAVLRASQALSSETSLDRLQARIVELLGAMTGATKVLVALWRYEPPGWHLSTGADTDALSVEQAAARGLLPIAAVRYVERTRQPLLVEDATRDGRFSADPYFARLECSSLLLVPILSHGTPRAMLLLENRLSRAAFSTDRLEAVTLIAGQLAVSFDNALLYASLEHKVAERTRALEAANRSLETLSITDPLTGLANRRRFAEVLEAEWKRALRPGSSIGMALIDIDHFKQYNDRYGHIAGDACLRRVAAALSQGVRQGTDLLVRYGGEEFAIVLPGADGRTAHAVAERARAAVAGLEEPHAGTLRGIVTVSAGTAAMTPTACDGVERLIHAADQALYEAKRNGRNQVHDADLVLDAALPRAGRKSAP